MRENEFTHSQISGWTSRPRWEPCTRVWCQTCRSWGERALCRPSHHTWRISEKQGTLNKDKQEVELLQWILTSSNPSPSVSIQRIDITIEINRIKNLLTRESVTRRRIYWRVLFWKRPRKHLQLCIKYAEKKYTHQMSAFTFCWVSLTLKATKMNLSRDALHCCSALSGARASFNSSEHSICTSSAYWTLLLEHPTPSRAQHFWQSVPHWWC